MLAWLLLSLAFAAPILGYLFLRQRFVQLGAPLPIGYVLVLYASSVAPAVARFHKHRAELKRAGYR